MSDGPIVLRRRPLTVQAWRVAEDNLATVADWCGGVVLHSAVPGIAFHADTGDLVHAGVGDWVVKGPFGKFYPTPDNVIFASYESIVSVVSQ